MEEQNVHYRDDDSEIKNLQRLLNAATQEKDLAIEMYRTSVQTIESLEEELETSEDRKKFQRFKKQIQEVQYQMQSDYTEAINILENKLANVSSDLQLEIDQNNKKSEEILVLSQKLDEVHEMERKCNYLHERERELDERCLMLETKCLDYEAKLQRVRPTEEQLEKQVDELSERLCCTERQLRELQTALERTQATAENLAIKEGEARGKVAEAVVIVETALVEKQQAINQQKLAECECKRLRKELMDLIEEAGVKVSNEVEIVRKECKNQMQSVISEMELIEKERDKKLCQIELLQAELLKVQNELQALKKNTVLLRKHQAVCTQLEQADSKISVLEYENKSLHELLAQNQQRDANQTSSSELILQVQNLQANNAITIKELQHFVDAHNRITKKWKGEYEHLTDKFRCRLKDMKADLKNEREMNKKLMRQIGVLRRRFEQDSGTEDLSAQETQQEVT